MIVFPHGTSAFPSSTPYSVIGRGGALIRTVFVLALVFASAVRAEVLDQVAATVNHDVITQSDLSFALALNARFGNVGADANKATAETLDGLITRRLLVQEARRLKFVEVSDQDIANESAALKKLFGSDKAFADFLANQYLTDQELNRMLGERLLIRRFIEKKVGLFVRVDRDEAQAYFDQHPAEFKGKRFPDVQKQIVAMLLDRKIGLQLDQYIAELRSKADVRITAR